MDALKFGLHVNYCVHAGNEKVLQDLVKTGKSLNWRDENEDAAIHIAAKLNRSKALKILITGGANMNAINKDKRNVLHIAVEHDSLECIDVLSEYSFCAELIKAEDKDKLRPWMIAYKKKKMDDKISRNIQCKILKLLNGVIRKSFDCIVLMTNNLKFAIDHDNEFVINNILENLPKFQMDYVDIERLLQRSVHYVNIRDSRQRTLTHTAVSQTNVKLLELLLKYKADCNLRDDKHSTALHYAVDRYNKCCVDDSEQSRHIEQFKKPSDVNLVSQLHFCGNNCVTFALIHLLVKANADLFAENYSNTRPLDYFVHDELVLEYILCNIKEKLPTVVTADTLDSTVFNYILVKIDQIFEDEKNDYSDISDKEAKYERAFSLILNDILDKNIPIDKCHNIETFRKYYTELLKQHDNSTTRTNDFYEGDGSLGSSESDDINNAPNVISSRKFHTVYDDSSTSRNELFQNICKSMDVCMNSGTNDSASYSSETEESDANENSVTRSNDFSESDGSLISPDSDDINTVSDDFSMSGNELVRNNFKNRRNSVKNESTSSTIIAESDESITVGGPAVPILNIPRKTYVVVYKNVEIQFWSEFANGKMQSIPKVHGNVKILEICEDNNAYSLNYYLTHGPKIYFDLKNDNFETVLHVCAKYAALDCLELMLRKNKLNIIWKLEKDMHNRTAIDIALTSCMKCEPFLRSRRAKIVACLLKLTENNFQADSVVTVRENLITEYSFFMDVSILKSNSSMQLLTICFAAHYGRNEVIRAVFEKYPNIFEETSIMSWQLGRLSLKHGMVSMQSNALINAVYHKQLNTIELLVTKKVNCNITNYDGHHPACFRWSDFRCCIWAKRCILLSSLRKCVLLRKVYERTSFILPNPFSKCVIPAVSVFVMEYGNYDISFQDCKGKTVFDYANDYKLRANEYSKEDKILAAYIHFIIENKEAKKIFSNVEEEKNAFSVYLKNRDVAELDLCEPPKPKKPKMSFTGNFRSITLCKKNNNE